MVPNRLAIIGNGGGGKSTAARSFADRWDIPLYSVDSVQWKPGWQRADPEDVARWHRTILESHRWIIDGWGAWDLIAERFERADSIVLVDFPLETHLEWARKRAEQSAQGSLPQEPEGCRYADIPELMEETLRRVDRDFLPKVRLMVAEHGGLVLKSPAELSSWLDQMLA